VWDEVSDCGRVCDRADHPLPGWFRVGFPTHLANKIFRKRSNTPM